MSAPSRRFGTSSWSEKSWVGPFYPKGTKPGDMITEYAKQFDTVELDASYYAIPARKVVQGWREKTPDGFLFAAKFPRDIVHGGEGAQVDAAKVLTSDDARRATDVFLKVMSELGPKLGPLVVQLPFFNKKAFADVDTFLARLDPFLAGLPDTRRYAVEVRNKDWLGPALTDVLAKHRAALVLVEINYMPHPADWTCDLVTTDFVYARLIGDRNATEKASGGTFDRIVLDKSEQLDKWAALIKRIEPKASKLFGYANNHYGGHGPATIRDLIERLERAGA